MARVLKYILTNIFVILYVNNASATWNNPFDLELYENALNPEECSRQLDYIRNNDTILTARFIGASFKIPKNILKGNRRDFGSYYECLEINESSAEFVSRDIMSIQGKYCLLDFSLALPNISMTDLDYPWEQEDPWEHGQYLQLPWKEFNPKTTSFSEELLNKMGQYEKMRYVLRSLLGENPEPTALSRNTKTTLADLSFELAVCIPKVCTSKQAVDSLIANQPFEFKEQYCRLPNDKTWVPADTVASVIIATIGLITILSTVYDILYTVVLNKDPKKANKIYQSFSVYTNTKNFFVFPSSPSVITCLDGIRSFAMVWVIVGHTFVTQVTYAPENLLDIVTYLTKFTSLWITSGTITVDTFFTIGGILVVYTTAAKVSRISLLKNLHLFYLNRLLRMFPVLAFAILISASFLHRFTDGPYYINVKNLVANCRSNWWSTLLYVQNLVNPETMCVPHSWYLAIDMQLFIFSPVILFFVLGQRKLVAWLAMVAALVGFTTGATIYNFINNFQSAPVSISRSDEDGQDYLFRYYVFTLTRTAPFFIGMLYGYLMHLYRKDKPKIPTLLALFYWVLALAGTTGVCIITYWNIQLDWDNQVMDNFINSFKRHIWAASIGWLIFACHNGYGGPINWLLSLHVFKIVGRLSYAMYILHYPMIYLLNATTLTPIYFSAQFSIYRFFTDLSFALIAAFIVTIIIDSPFANLIKMVMGSGPRRPPQKEPSTLGKEHPELGENATSSYGDEKKAQL